MLLNSDASIGSCEKKKNDSRPPATASHPEGGDDAAAPVRGAPDGDGGARHLPGGPKVAHSSVGGSDPVVRGLPPAAPAKSAAEAPRHFQPVCSAEYCAGQEEGSRSVPETRGDHRGGGRGGVRHKMARHFCPGFLRSSAHRQSPAICRGGLARAEHGVGRVWPDARTSSRAGGCAVANSSPAACASRRAARVAEQAGPRWVGVG